MSESQFLTENDKDGKQNKNAATNRRKKEKNKYRNGFLFQEKVCLKVFQVGNTAEKVSVFGVILVRTFPYLDKIRRDTPEYLAVFSPNTGKDGPE